jgi:hypothetical protein
MNSAPESYSVLDSSSPLELALDRAMDQMDQRASELQLLAQRSAPSRAKATALVVSRGETALATLPGRLHWRGIAVSEEFQRYAARVACGEQLAPYRGQVLARPCPEFPWGAAPRLRTQRSTPRFGQKAKLGAMMLSAGTALLAAIGVGSGAASPVEDEVDALVPEQGTSALEPAPYVDQDDRLASVNAAEHVAASGDTRAKARTKTTARRTRSAPLRRNTATTSATGSTVNASFSSSETSGVSSAAGTAGPISTEPEETFGLDELGPATGVPDATKLAVGATPPQVTKQPGPTSVPGQRSAKAVSRVGEPSDWDPTGKMSILFSDDLPF